MKRVAIFPGSFDPMHDGHIHILKKALQLFDEIIVAVTSNKSKPHQGPLEPRITAAAIKVADLGTRVKVIGNAEGLTVNIAKQYGAKFLVRGLRSNTDFKNEMALYDINRMLSHDIETVYFMADDEERELSSTLLKELERYQQ